LLDMSYEELCSPNGIVNAQTLMGSAKIIDQIIRKMQISHATIWSTWTLKVPPPRELGTKVPTVMLTPPQINRIDTTTIGKGIEWQWSSYHDPEIHQCAMTHQLPENVEFKILDVMAVPVPISRPNIETSSKDDPKMIPKMIMTLQARVEPIDKTLYLNEKWVEEELATQGGPTEYTPYILISGYGKELALLIPPEPVNIETETEYFENITDQVEIIETTNGIKFTEDFKWNISPPITPDDIEEGKKLMRWSNISHGRPLPTYEDLIAESNMGLYPSQGIEEQDAWNQTSNSMRTLLNKDYLEQIRTIIKKVVSPDNPRTLEPGESPSHLGVTEFLEQTITQVQKLEITRTKIERGHMDYEWLARVIENMNDPTLEIKCTHMVPEAEPGKIVTNYRSIRAITPGRGIEERHDANTFPANEST
jgi:hypothetical protein